MPRQSVCQSVRSTESMCRRNRLGNSIKKTNGDGRYRNYRLLLFKGCLYFRVAVRNHYSAGLLSGPGRPVANRSDIDMNEIVTRVIPDTTAFYDSGNFAQRSQVTVWQTDVGSLPF